MVMNSLGQDKYDKSALEVIDRPRDRPVLPMLEKSPFDESPGHSEEGCAITENPVSRELSQALKAPARSVMAE